MLLYTAAAQAPVTVVHNLEEALLNLSQRLVSRGHGACERQRRPRSVTRRADDDEERRRHLRCDLLGCFPNDVVQPAAAASN
jgi:hypothetical protein